MKFNMKVENNLAIFLPRGYDIAKTEASYTDKKTWMR